MREDNVREMGAAVTDKKELLLQICLKAAYVLVALASVISLILMMAGDNRVIAFEGLDALSIYYYILMPVSALAMLVLTVMNIVRDYPRLMMLFAGSSVYFSLQYLVRGWVPALLLFCAGLAAFLLTAYRQRTLLKDDACTKVKGKMLIIAAVLAILHAFYQGYVSIINAMVYAVYGYSGESTIYFFSGLTIIAFNLALAAACFMKNRPTSVFYRMFFLGASLVLTLQNPISLISVDFAAAGILGYLQIAVVVAIAAIAVLVILHAIRTRKKPAALHITADEAAEEAEALSEDAEVELENDDDFDETIGLYREDDADQ